MWGHGREIALRASCQIAAGRRRVKLAAATRAATSGRRSLLGASIIPMTRVNRCATGALLLAAVWRWLTYWLAIRTDSGRGPSMSGRLRSAPVANRQALPIGFAASLGIHVTVLALGLLRTDWAGRSMVRAPRSIPDYDAVFDRSARPAAPRAATRPVTQPPRPAHCLRYSNHPTHQCIWCWVRTPCAYSSSADKASRPTATRGWVSPCPPTSQPTSK